MDAVPDPGKKTPPAVITATAIGAANHLALPVSYVVAIRISGRWKQPCANPVTTAARLLLVSCWNRGSRSPATRSPRRR